MIRRSALLLTLTWTLFNGTASGLPADEGGNGNPGAASTRTGVQLEATFAAVTGASLTTTSGHAQQRDGELIGMYSSYASVPEGQPRPLVLRLTEDHTMDG